MKNFRSYGRGHGLSLARSILIVACFVVIGFFAVHITHAATYATSAEAESGHITGNAKNVSSRDASANLATLFGVHKATSPPRNSGGGHKGGSGGSNGGSGGATSGGSGGSGSPTSNTCPSPHPVAPVAGYHVTGCEDFNHGLGKFVAYEGGGGDTVVGKGRVASQCRVSSGYLHEVQKSNGATCGGAIPSFHQVKGLWEVRMRAYSTGSSGSSPHPVLILWPHNEDYNAELDYFETDLGQPAQGYLHCIGESNVFNNCFHIPNNPVDYSKWHVYSFLWTNSGMTGYIDGKKWWSDNNSNVVPPESVEQTIQLDNLTGSLPVKSGEMDVDWAHMYKLH